MNSSAALNELVRNLDSKLTQFEEQSITMLQTDPKCHCHSKAPLSMLEQGVRTLSLMKDSMKPTLICVGALDEVSVSQEKAQSSYTRGIKLFPQVESLCFNDIKLICVNLDSETSHFCDYKFLAYMA